MRALGGYPSNAARGALLTGTEGGRKPPGGRLPGPFPFGVGLSGAVDFALVDG